MQTSISHRVQEILPSQTLRITSLIKRFKREQKDVVNFAAGEPDFDTPEEVKQEAKKALDEGITKYTPVAGLSELREAISVKFKEENNLEYKPEEIVVSNGAKHSIFNVLFALLNPGDEVIIIAPYWVSYPEMVKLASGKPVFVSLTKESGFRPDFKRIKSQITSRTKCVILNTPTNPTGIVWNEKELEELAELALENNFYIISDEIYEHLIYKGKHISIGSLSKKIFEKTVTISGVSKSFAMTGWRIGWMGAPLKIANEVTKIQSHMTSNSCSISQKAALKALSLKQEWFSYLRSEFLKRRDFLISELEKKEIPFIKPQGAFYIFLDISSTHMDSLSFAEKLLKEKMVGVIPGKPFGNDNFVRISYAVSLNEIEKGIKRIWEFLNG